MTTCLDKDAKVAHYRQQYRALTCLNDTDVQPAADQIVMWWS